MYKNVSAQGVYLFAYDTTNSVPKTGDAANITGKVSKDGGAGTSLSTSHPTEIGGGVYWHPLSQAETNGDALAFYWSSATSGVQIDPVLVSPLPGTSSGVMADVEQWKATNVPSPATAGIPDVNTKNLGGVTVPLDSNNLLKVDLEDIKGTASAGAAGSVGVDWAHVANATSTVSLTNTTVNATVAGYASGQDPATLVLDVAAASHNTAGTIGQKINAAGGAADPLTNAVPGAYAPGTAGHVLGQLPDVPAGNANGLWILGAMTGPASISCSSDVFTLHSTGLNGRGLVCQGNGTGDGLAGVGGATAGNGISGTGGGPGNGIKGAGGVTGDGILGLGGATSGDGIQGTGQNGNGIHGQGGGASAHGLFGQGGTAGTSDGIKGLAGTGGVDIRGNITGNLSGSVGSVTAGVTVTTNNDKTGYSLTQAFPANFAAMLIAPGGAVTIDQTTVVPMVNVTADNTLTVGKALLAARAQAAGAWTIAGTTLTIKNPDGSTFRTFTLDSSSAPTQRA